MDGIRWKEHSLRVYIEAAILVCFSTTAAYLNTFVAFCQEIQDIYI